jgi:hypothetical protein
VDPVDPDPVDPDPDSDPDPQHWKKEYERLRQMVFLSFQPGED